MSVVKRMTFVAGCILSLALLAAPAQAFELTEFGGSMSIGGTFTRQAGTHPDLTTFLGFDQEGVKTVTVDLPPGVIANPTVAETCPRSGLTAGVFGRWAVCPVGSQVGVLRVMFYGRNPNSPPNIFPLYNMERPIDSPALLAANAYGVLVKVKPSVRSSDYGITGTVTEISQAEPIHRAELVLWGVPADSSHDAERTGPNPDPVVEPAPPASSALPPLPFVTAPTQCSGTPLTTYGSADSWLEPGAPARHGSFSGDPQGIPFRFSGCNKLRFEPSLSIAPDSRQAGSPTGLSVDLRIPQSESPYGLATPDLRQATVTLPPGFSLSTSAAQGLAGCSLSQIKLGSDAPDACPPSATIGSVRIKTPLLDEELEGRVVLAAQGDNPFGSLVALYLVVPGPGVLLKIPGKVDLDQATGQVRTTFANTPQLPFEDLRLTLRGGPASPLVSPNACGNYQASAELTSWASDAPVPIAVPIAIGEGCAGGGFAPGLQAGTVSPKAGSYSPFVLRVTREDREANLSAIRATLPEGLLAKLAGIPLCDGAAAASGACPAASQIGTTTIGAGAGALPLYVPEAGRAPTAVYLSGPYKGAPYSLVVRVPAQAGPFDLGTVVVRNALRVDPTTTQVTAESDPLPQILQGIPVSYRDVRVEVNRPGFTLNPTSCRAQTVRATLTSAAGQSASPSTPFAASDCARLGFGPKLALSFKGKTKRTGNPALTAVLKPRPGDANLEKAAVILPRSSFIDNAHINSPCTRPQFAEGKCPPKSILGSATAYTPLLDEPLSGPVYFRSNGGERELPDLVVDLDGQIHVTLVGFIDSVKVGKEGSRVRTRFQTVPDAPVSRFVLQLKGGKQGLIENSTSLCKAPQRASVKLEGQNGRVASTTPKIAVKCGKRKR